ncbi:hypothetical protein F4774DRAFT_375098 [Daldinia eschscholtzii]|nr:hypothetical protein F4774DRAFT_375098 [Daldinia eschscholtzii]
MDIILDIRDPKGGGRAGGGGHRYKGGGGYHGGSGGSPIPWWAWMIIVFGSVWLIAYIFLAIHFFRKDRLNLDPNEPRPSGARQFARSSWRALRYMTGIQVFVWAYRKIRSKTDKGTKKVGGSFYKKIDEEERGAKSGSEQAVAPTPPAQLHEEPAPPPAYSNDNVR